MSVGSRTGKKRGQDDSGRPGSIWKGKWAESVAICLCLLLLGLFVSCKEGFHMDELLSFELANARFNPWIVTTQPEGRLAKFVRNEIDGETFGETIGNLVETVKDVIENRGASKLLTYQADVYEEPVWITAEQFKDYITVDKKDAFQYLSVYFNVKDDNHPPLHFMVLHTISSLFRGQAKPWMGCVINLAAMAAVMALLMGLGRMLAEAGGCREEGRKRMIGLCCGLLYGLSCGAVATTLLIRMYGLLTLWCVAYFYLILQKWRDRAFDRHNIRLIFVTLLGFWTQYFFLFYCILLAGTVCVLLFREKRTRELLHFVRSMVLAAVVGVAVFPFAVQDVLQRKRGGGLAESGDRLCRLWGEAGCFSGNPGGEDFRGAFLGAAVYPGGIGIGGKRAEENRFPTGEENSKRTRAVFREGGLYLDACPSRGRLFPAGSQDVTLSGGPLYDAGISLCDSLGRPVAVRAVISTGRALSFPAVQEDSRSHFPGCSPAAGLGALAI